MLLFKILNRYVNYNFNYTNITFFLNFQYRNTNEFVTTRIGLSIDQV